jgi:hypothetical protein
MNQTFKIFLSIFTIFSLLGCVENQEERISFDKDGMLLIKGERKFIIGSYHLPKTKTPFESLASNGYNYVRVGPNKAQLDKASKFNLMTWITTGSIKEKDKSDTTRITELVDSFKDHPSLLFWEMVDEPAFSWNSAEPRVLPQEMQETYNFIKKIDSEHLIITNHGPVNLISTLQKYNSSTDLVACDVYPVIPHGIIPTFALYPDGLQGDLLNPYISQVGEYVDKMKKVVNNSKPVFMVLQGFSWEMLKNENERDTSMILYPTYEESRFMAYNAIVHGANGILYWGTSYTPQPSVFMDDLNKVTKELAELQNVLSAQTIKLNIKKEYHELMYSVDAGVEIMVKKVEGKTYMLTVNSDKNPVKVSFIGLSKYKNATVLKEKRSLILDNGKLTDYYKPFDTHIYFLE